MNDKKWIIAGIVAFLVIFAFPLWYNMGRGAPAPKPVLSAKAKAAGKCVMPTEYMHANHMQLLDKWRYTVVRKAEREFVNADGKTFTMSLTNTCLDCHSNKADFCDKCHTYASVKPYCWDCHLDRSKEKE